MLQHSRLDELPVSSVIVQHPMVVPSGGTDDDVGAVHWIKVKLRHVVMGGERFCKANVRHIGMTIDNICFCLKMVQSTNIRNICRDLNLQIVTNDTKPLVQPMKYL